MPSTSEKNGGGRADAESESEDDDQTEAMGGREGIICAVGSSVHVRVRSELSYSPDRHLRR
jgi:hypothetical protein